MRLLRVLLAVGMLAVLIGATGCCGGGGKVETKQTTTTTTLGQELQDLDEAYKKGLMTEEQYNEAKEKLLKQRTEN